MVVSIVVSLGWLYLFANLLIASFFLDKILATAFAESTVLNAFTRLILYYFLADLLMRFQLQELPTLQVRPYLILPVSKTKIVNYLSLTSLWSGFNLAPFLLMIPFLMKELLSENISGFIGLVISLIGLTLLNHFFCLWLKRKINLNAWFLAGFFIVLSMLGFTDYYLKLFSISGLSAYIFNSVLNQPYWALLPLLVGGTMYYINHRFLKANLYLDVYTETSSNKGSTNIPFLKQFGISGELVALEIKLILRNKRPKSTLIMCFAFMFYGLIFYNGKHLSEMIKIFSGLMMTGIFIINYGQFMFSWQSAHFDGILANKISTKDFLKAKFILFNLFSTAALILTVPYVYFGWKILLIHVMLYFLNTGVSSVVVLAFANWNYKYIDLSKGSSFNWEGVGASQFIVGIPLFLFPIIVYGFINFLFTPLAGILALGFIGLIFILSRNFWLSKLANKFSEKRYQIAEGFRNH